MKNNISRFVSIGRGAKLDKTALVGAAPLRRIKKKKAIIGNNAICLSGSVIYLGNKIGKNLVLGHNSIIREENVIGDDLKLWNNSVIDYGCRIGSGVKIHCNCYIAQYSKIEDNCFLAPGVILTNDLHPGCKSSRECLKGPTIKKGAQIGANVTILPGIVVGEGALIGAGSVVVKDVPAKMVACGNPAKVVCSIDEIKCKSGLLKKYIKLTVHG